MACHVRLFFARGKLKKQPFSKFKKEKYPSIVFNIQDINESIFPDVVFVDHQGAKWKNLESAPQMCFVTLHCFVPLPFTEMGLH